MFKNKKVTLITVSTLALIVAVGLVAFAPFDSASAAELTNNIVSRRGGPGDFGQSTSRETDNTYLLEALGITAEEFQAAQEAAHVAAIEQALDDGLITQAQADRLANLGVRALRLFVGPDSGIDGETLLAEALGISVDDLTAARDTAKEAALEQALADGKITEEQVALLEARTALKDYVEEDALVAQALGMTVEEFQAAQEDGQRIPDLLDELGLDRVTFDANLQAATEETLQQAVDDGVITQEQADLLLARLLERGLSQGREWLQGLKDSSARPNSRGSQH